MNKRINSINLIQAPGTLQWAASIATTMDGEIWIPNTLTTRIIKEVDPDEKEFRLLFDLFEICRILGFTKNQFINAIPDKLTQANFRRELVRIRHSWERDPIGD